VIDGSQSPPEPKIADPQSAADVPRGTAPQGRHVVVLGRDFGSKYAVVFATFVLLAAFSFALPDTFPTVGNLTTMITSQSVLLLLALAVTLPLRAGDFDLSIGAVMAFSAAMAGVLTTQFHLPTALVIILCVLTAVLIGAINATLIVIIGIDAFITTLGTMTVLAGATFAVTNSRIIAGLPEALTNFSRFEILGLPLATYYGWILLLVLWYLYEYTPVGRYLLFVGGNRDASRLTGLPVEGIRFGAFVGSAMISGFAGVTLVGTLGAVDPSIGPQFLLQPYAAAFLGTATIQVGRFNVFGTVVALYMLVIGITGLQLMGAPPWVSDVFNGGALIVAVTFARLAGRGRQS
jgi:ribose transport system permease protein